MTSTRKSLVATFVALMAGLAIYELRQPPEAPQAENSAPPATPSTQRDVAHSTSGARSHGKPSAGGPRSLLQPRLNEAGKRQLQLGPGAVLDAHATGDGGAWSRADDNLLVAWAALDPAAALKWVNAGDHAVVRAQLLGAVAAGILLHDGKDAMRRFLDAHQQDPQLRGKDQGELEKFLFYHLGREDTFEAAMDILGESRAGSLAGTMITGIEGAQLQTNAIDYMEAKGIPVTMDYWTHREAINMDPRFWADWAWKRDSDMLAEIVDGWVRYHPDEATDWVEERIPKNDKHRAEIDGLLQARESE